MIKAVICDWNGTIFEDLYEEKFFKGLAENTIRTFPAYLNVYRLYNFWKVKKKCEKIFNKSKNVEDRIILEQKVRQVVTLMNKNIFKDVTTRQLSLYTKKYAITACGRIDKRLLGPLFELKRKHNILLGIISSGYKEGIKSILEHENYYFDSIMANDFEISKGKIREYTLTILNNKQEILERFLEKNDISLSETVYIGDDWQDENCFRCVKYPILSFFSVEGYRKYFSEKLGIFMPKSEDDLNKHLEGICSK